MSEKKALSLGFVAAVMVVILALGAVTIYFIQAHPSPTHMVLLVLDTVRADRLGCYGHDRETTPRLDELAKNGLLFENARSNAPWTLPSHASLFTGLHPSEHGCHFEHRYLVESHETIAETLGADFGIETMGITSNVNTAAQYHLAQGFDDYREVWTLREAYPGLEDSSIVNAEVEKWLQTRNKKQPFFLFLNYMDAHLPHAPTAPYDRMFGAVSESARSLAAEGDLLRDVLRDRVTWTDSLKEDFGRLYDADLRKLDDRIAELLRLFESQGILDDIFLVVTSDHGEFLGEGGMVDHQLSLAEELLRVPLIVHFPDRVVPQRIAEPISHVQITHWFVQVAVGAVPEWTPPPERSPVGWFAEYSRPVELLEFLAQDGIDPSPYDRRLRSVYEETGFKYLLDSHRQAQLTRWDGGQELEVSEGEHQEEWRSLEATLRDFNRRPPFHHQRIDYVESAMMGEEALEELRELGYVTDSSTVGQLGLHASEHWSAARRFQGAGDLATAQEEFRAALRISPEQPGILFEAAVVEDKVGGESADDLWRRFLRAAEKDPSTPPARIHLANERLRILTPE